MSKGPWKKCPVTGLSLKRLAEIDERFLDDQGNFDTSRWPDCNLFDVSSIAAAAGYSEKRYFGKTVLTAPNSPFHYHEVDIQSLDGRSVAKVYPTHTNSAQAGAERYRRDQIQKAKDGAVLPPIDVRSLSNI